MTSEPSRIIISDALKDDKLITQLSKQEIIKMILECDEFSIDEAKTLIKKLAEQFGSSAVEFLPFINIKNVERDEALSILGSIKGIQLFAALDDDQSQTNQTEPIGSSEDENDGIDIDYEFHYNKAKETVSKLEKQIDFLNLCLSYNGVQYMHVENTDMFNDVLEKYFSSKEREIAKEILMKGITVQEGIIVKALRRAIIKCDISTIQILFRYIKGEQRTSAFILACERGNQDVLTVLIKHVSSISFCYDSQSAILNILSNSKLSDEYCYDLIFILKYFGCTIHLLMIRVAIMNNRELSLQCLLGLQRFNVSSIKKFKNKANPSIKSMLQKIIKQNYRNPPCILVGLPRAFLGLDEFLKKYDKR